MHVHLGGCKNDAETYLFIYKKSVVFEKCKYYNIVNIYSMRTSDAKTSKPIWDILLKEHAYALIINLLIAIKVKLLKRNRGDC